MPTAPNDWFWDGEATPLADERMRDAQLLREQDSARRTKGTARSAQVRPARYVERNRRIHDAYHVDGKMPKQIADDKKIRGKKKLGLSQIRRIIAASRP